MADLVVSPLVKLVKQQVIDYLKYQYKLHSGVNRKLDNLADALIRIEAVADTADELDLEEHKLLKEWKGKLKVAAEEATDVLDEFEYLCLKFGAEDEPLRFCPPSRKCLESFTKSQHGFIPSLFRYVKRFVQFAKPLERLSSIQRDLNELDRSAERFLQVLAARKAIDQEHHKQDMESTSSMNEPDLVGRKNESGEIIKKLRELLEDELVVHNIPVVSVVGHGGMGKTTLAQHVFNDEEVTSLFDVRMWVYVSLNFDVLALTRKMIEAAAPQKNYAHIVTLDQLQKKLQKALRSKKFLIVLDELWYGQNMTKTEMMTQWDKLFGPLKHVGREGSKMLVTSSKPEVENLPGALHPVIHLKELEPIDLWSIIKSHAFPNGQNCQHLEAVGEKIARKLHGWPLAAKAVGLMLKDNVDEKRWLTFLNKKIPRVRENECMPVLKMQYQQLAPHLRKCFTYCSLFPKRHEFDVDMLVRMWVAHGYVNGQPKEGETEEDTARSYLDDLLSAGVFTTYQKVNGYPSKVVMHELMNVLATSISKDESLRIIEEDTLPQDGNIPIPVKVRHLSVRSDYLAKLNKKNLSNLQTLIVFPSYEELDEELDDNHVREVLSQLRRVRVLDLHGCQQQVKELPDQIGDCWVHLRYLDLSYTQIGRLPEWIWRLYHLQLLNIEKTNIPTGASLEKLSHLVKLRFVGSDIDLKLTWVRGLESLQVLRANLLLERGSGREIGSLDALDKLRGSLVLKGLDYVQSGDEARAAYLCRKEDLESLFMTWVVQDSSSPCRPDVAADVLEHLKPHSNLSLLNINNYPGTRSPDWMGAKYLRLNKLEITRCPELGALPILSPTISEVKFVNVGISSLPGFHDDHGESSSSSSSSNNAAPPNLSKLTIEHCNNLTSLDEGLLDKHNQHRLSSLKELIIKSCKQLVSLPDVGFRQLISLKILQIVGCPILTWVMPNQDPSLLPSSLEELTISNIDDDAVSRCLHGLTSLSKLKIRKSPNLKSLPSPEELACLSSSLQELLIIDCEALVPTGLDGLLALASLKLLRIERCPELHSTADDGEDIGRGSISVAVERLVIDNPLMLIKVPVLKSLSSVQQVHIKDASGFTSFAPELEAWLLQNDNSLWRVEIRNTELLSLPDLRKFLEKLGFSDANDTGRYERDRHIKHTDIP